MTAVRPAPCRYCPYRKDVPPGVWHRDEYAKLVLYDAPTGEQPMSTFACHEKSGLICAGWAQCHGEGLLGLRLASCVAGEPIVIPAQTSPIFASGMAAAVHGMAGIRRPGRKAIAAMAYLRKVQSAKRRTP